MSPLQRVTVPGGVPGLRREREAGRFRGFGSVELESDEEAESARRAPDGFEVDGRPSRADTAQPRPAAWPGGPFAGGRPLLINPRPDRTSPA